MYDNTIEYPYDSSLQDKKSLKLERPSVVNGFNYIEDQTFGVEIEFTSPFGSPNETGLVYSNLKWQSIARYILEIIENVAAFPVDRQPRNYHEVKDTARWRVEFDRSAGWEVVSPILSNQEGFLELINVMSALHKMQQRSEYLHINHRTGLHITLGSHLRDDQQVQGLIRFGQILEPGLFTLVSPSRLYEYRDGQYFLGRNNRYCLPLRRLENNMEELGLVLYKNMEKNDSTIRYHTINLCHLNGENQHIEIRVHNGTTEYPVIVAWISLWMTLFNQLSFRWPRRGNISRIFPGGNIATSANQARKEDLFALLEHLGVSLDPCLRGYLFHRRRKMLEQWRKVIPRRVLSWRKWWQFSPVGKMRIVKERDD